MAGAGAVGVVAVTARVLGIEPGTHVPHALHGPDQTWSETNCYVDLWIEVLAALGHDPVPAAACTLSADFEGDQWWFLKFPAEDLRRLYGIEVTELNIWRTLEAQIEEQLRSGRLLTMEVDAWYLPDVPVSYRLEHVKTTIIPNAIDGDDRRLQYFHNAGYFELADDDYDGILRKDDPAYLTPYVELIKVDSPSAPEGTLRDRAEALAHEHLSRRPATSPIARFGDRVRADLAWLATQPLAMFHQWAFASCRQLGANAELAAAFVEWLDDDGRDPALLAAASDLRAVADTAKSLQFSAARAARGRAVDVQPLLGEMQRRWDAAIGSLATHYGV